MTDIVVELGMLGRALADPATREGVHPRYIRDTCRRATSEIRRLREIAENLLELFQRESKYAHWEENNSRSYLWGKVIKWTRKAAQAAKEKT